jgi:hypothetical protein
MDYRTMLTEIGLFLSLYSIGKVRNLGLTFRVILW